MWNPWEFLVLLFLAASCNGDIGPCAPTCECPKSPSETEVNCYLKGDEEATLLSGYVANYVNIECPERYNEKWCEELPSMGWGRNETLKSVGLKFCPAPSNFSCLLRTLQATSVETLVLNYSPDGVVLLDDFFNLLSLKNLRIQGGENDTVHFPGAAISSAKQLKNLSIMGGRLVTGKSSLFPTPEPRLEMLELTNLHLDHLPEGIANLANLKILRLWSNDLKLLTASMLKGLNALLELDVSSNSIPELSGTSFQFTPNLEKLTAYDNPLKTVHVLAPLPKLEKVKISDNQVNLTLEPGAFANLPNLKYLDLESSRISALPKDLFIGSTALRDLDLQNNFLTELPQPLFTDQTALRTLDLSRNRIKNLSQQVFWTLRSLIELKLDGNLLTQLPEYLLEGVNSLETLSIRENQLTTLPLSSFGGATRLTHLLLSNNHIQLDKDSEVSPFNSLSKLKVLDLSHNRLEISPPDVPLILLNLKLYNLSHNYIDQLGGGEYSYDISYLSSKIVVDLRYNKISTVRLPLAVGPSGPPPDSEAGRLLLSHNPLFCDCELYSLAQRVAGWRPSPNYSDPILDASEARCAGPPHLATQLLSNVPLDAFACPVECKPGCTCTKRPGVNAIEVDCKTINATQLPQLEYGIRELHVQLRSLPGNLSWLPPSVTMLNLSGLQLNEPPDTVPDTVRLLDLSSNSLTYPPTELLEKNMTLRLANNPFACDCFNNKRVAMMQHRSRMLQDYETIQCDEGKLLKLTDASRLCDLWVAGLLGGGFFMLIVFIVILVFVYRRYSLRVCAFLYKHGLWVEPWKESSDKRYDVFISFCHQDTTQALDLVERLEASEQRFHVCVHCRDWVPGESILMQIERSIEQSHRTLVLVSKNFLESDWGQHEFRSAHAKASGEGKNRLVLVLLEDVRGHPGLDEEMKTYLASNTYLERSDAWFWEKLIYVLPHRKKAKTGHDNLAAIVPGSKLVQLGDNKAYLGPPRLLLSCDDLKPAAEPQEQILSAPQLLAQLQYPEKTPLGEIHIINKDP